MIAEIKQAARFATSRPGLTIAASLTIALGIGLSTAVFSAVDAVLLRELPYPDPDRIFKLEISASDEPDRALGFRKTELAAMRSVASLSQMGTAYGMEAILEDENEPTRVRGMMIDHGYLKLLGVTPLVGSLFSSDDITTEQAVAMVSESFWRTRFGSDPSLPGTTITISGTSYVVTGIVPSTFESPEGPADVWLNFNHGTTGWTGRYLSIYGRRDANATLADVERSTTAAVLEVARSDDLSTKAIDLKDDLVGEAGRSTMMVFLASGLILLIACLNVSGLLLARTVERGREMAVRISLGASKVRLARMLISEALATALPGGLLGIIMAYALVGAIRASVPVGVHGASAMAVSATALAFATVMVLFAALATTIAPLLAVTRTQPGSVLTTRSASVSKGTRSGFSLLAISEIALALTLSVSAGLVFQSLNELASDDKGFDTENVLAMRVNLPASRYPDAASTAAFFSTARDRAEALPGVRAAGFLSHLPVSGRSNWWRVNSDLRLASGETERLQAVSRIIGPGALNALGVAIIEGRDFESFDDESANARVIVNETLANQLWPGESAVGRRLTSSREPEEGDWLEVIAVVTDVRFTSVREPASAQIYTPQAQRGWNEMYFMVASDRDQARTIAALVTEMDDRVIVDQPIALDELVRDTMAMDRFLAFLFGSFGLAALVLTGVGIYGVISFVVRSRVREYGIRSALGAVPGRLGGAVLGDTARLLVTGTIVGFMGAWASGRLLSSLLYNTSALEPAALAAALAAVATAAMFAAMMPAMRAMRADPVEVLREE